MQTIADFFVDPLVWPAYLYFAAYGVMWIIACLLARLFMNQVSIESAAKRAWFIAIIMHLLGGTVLIIWLWGRALPRVAEWWHIPIYLIFYLLIVIVDVYLLVSLSTQNGKKSSIKASPPKPVGKSLNPKKK